jgi:hypothetical protein
METISSGLASAAMSGSADLFAQLGERDAGCLSSLRQKARGRHARQRVYL